MQENLAEMMAESRCTVYNGIESGKYDKKSFRDLLSFMIDESLPDGTAAGMTDEYIVGHVPRYVESTKSTFFRPRFLSTR